MALRGPRDRPVRQVIDVYVSARRDADAAGRSFQQAIDSTSVRPVEVTTDRAPVYPAVLEALLPAAWHRTDQYANNRIECVTTADWKRDCDRCVDQAEPQRRDDHRGACVGAEPSARALRTGGRGVGDSAGDRRVQRAGHGDLTPNAWQSFSTPCIGPTQQRPRRNSAAPRALGGVGSHRYSMAVRSTSGAQTHRQVRSVFAYDSTRGTLRQKR